MSNTSLMDAKRARNDEFYTLYGDVAAEMEAYVLADPGLFHGRTVLLPCDDPDRSNFTRYFTDNFQRFGLRRLVSTCYRPAAHGRIRVWESDRDGQPIVVCDGLLDGDGDYRSDEPHRLRDETDYIISNIPFSETRGIVKWLTETDARFAFIASMNAITYKEVFPLLKDNRMWLGVTTPKEFTIPKTADTSTRGNIHQTETGEYRARFGNICWYTNIDHRVRRQPLPLHTMRENLTSNRRLIRKLHDTYHTDTYPMYDNYPALEVPYTDAIPSDYMGVMGVPVTFMTKYNPEQFEIVTFRKGLDGRDLLVPDGADAESIGEKRLIQPYNRILIRARE